MKSRLLLSGLLALTARTAQGAFVSPQDPRIQVMGRYAVGADQELRMGFPGVCIRFAYRGPAPVALLDASNDDTAFNVSVNGEEPRVVSLKKRSNELSLSSSPAPATGWSVELMRRNESWQGLNTFRGLTLPPGSELLPLPVPPSRKLLFIGDSITCGESVDRVPPGPAEGPGTSNAGHAFGMLLGKMLKSQVHLVSCGGRGLTRNWKGQTEDVTAPQFFQRALPDDPATSWDHARYIPDAVIVGLGTNDLSSGIPDQAAFTSAYEAFLADIRKAYPGTALVLTESPIFSETPGDSDWAKRDFLRRCLDAILAKRQAMGDLKLAIAPLHQYQGSASNAHPVAFQHEKIAGELAPVIRSVAGW